MEGGRVKQGMQPRILCRRLKKSPRRESEGVCVASEDRSDRSSVRRIRSGQWAIARRLRRSRRPSAALPWQGHRAFGLAWMKEGFMAVVETEWVAGRRGAGKIMG